MQIGSLVGGRDRHFCEQSEVTEQSMSHFPVPTVEGNNMSLRADNFLLKQLNKIPGHSPQQLHKRKHLPLHPPIFTTHPLDTIPRNPINIIILILKLLINQPDKPDHNTHIKPLAFDNLLFLH